MTTIQITIKSYYGVECIYPQTYHEELLALTGRKTLQSRHIDALKAMGFTFEILNEKLI